MHFRRIVAIFIGGALLFGTGVQAEEPHWFVRSWLSDDGLPDNDVTGITQDARGYLWVATQGGLAKFDGVRFREIELPTPSQRSRPLIRAMLQGSGGGLWLALEGGTVVSLTATRTNVFSTADGLPAFRPSSLAEARDGAVWIGYVDGSACRIAKGKVLRFTAKSGLSGVGPCVLSADNQGQIWFAKAGELSLYRDEKINYIISLPEGAVRMTPARSAGLWVLAGTELLRVEEGKAPVTVASLHSAAAGMSPAVVYEDHSGAVWLGTLAGGLFRVKGSAVVAVTTSYPDVLSLMEDREGNLWAGTGGGGLNRLRPRVLELQNAENGLPFSSVRSVCEDTNGNIWAAAQNGTLARRQAGRWINVSAEKEWAGMYANCVADDGQGGVWVGTSHDGLRHWRDGRSTSYTRNDGLGGDNIRALLTDRDGNLWIATESPSSVQRLQGGKFTTFSRPAGTRTVRAFAQDHAGTLWLGTVDGFLLRMENDKIVDATEGTLARRKPVRCLYVAPDGDLWIGYAGAGIGRLHEGKFSTLATERGLHDGYICAMTQDDGGGFWFCSDHGIFQVRQYELENALAGKTESVRSVLFGREESLPSLQGNFGYGPGFMRGRDGKIWFPTRSGLVVINPNQTEPNHLVPPVVIERVRVDGVPVATAADGEIELPPRHRKVEIEFTALSFVAPENVAFRCQLENWDDGWIPVPRGERSVSYNHLPAGQYNFRVTACNNAGIWNDTATTQMLTVEPFWWQSWWFKVVVMSVSLAGVAAAVRYYSHRKYQLRLRKLEAEAVLQKERARIAKDIHDELGANLTQISLLGKFTLHDLSVPQQAAAHVEKIASIARQGVRSVDEIVWAVNPRNDTLSQLLDYAGQYAVDFLRAAGIRCRIDFPENIPVRVLPADIRHGLFMVVKEALHNAVKHSGATEIILRAEFSDPLLALTITDNGRGFAAPKDDALADGLRNMQQRATDLGGVCTITSQPAAGTKVRVELSLP